MSQDKQLQGEVVVQSRMLDQALNATEFTVLAGISYSAAHTWSRQPSFPVVGGVVFWQDFVQWRKDQTGQTRRKPAQGKDEVANVPSVKLQFAEHAGRIFHLPTLFRASARSDFKLRHTV